MASSPEKQNEEKCPICFEQFNMPRKLPGCSHSFCENCVLTFILDLKKEEKLGSEFECPVCRLPSQSPGKDDVIHRWIRSLEVNEELKPKVVPEIKDYSTDCCSQCHYLKKTVIAVKYCLTCQEYYCGTCADTVHAFKINSNHTIMDTDTEKSERIHGQALKMLNSFIKCTDHNQEPVMLFCEDDKKLCCVSCSIDKHKTCRNMKPISDMKSVVFKEESTKLLSLTANLEKHMQGVIGTIKGNNDVNKKQLEKSGAEFQEMKQKVVKLLDIMEENLNQEGKAAIKRVAMKNQDEIDKLDGMKMTIKTVQYLIENILGNMSVEEVFACIHETELVLEGIEMSVINMGNTIKTEGIELNITDTFKLIQNLGPNETSQLASINGTETDTALPSYEDRPFLRKYIVKKTGMYNILPKDVGAAPTYSGLWFLPENNILLVDSYYGFICLVDEQFTASASCTLLGGDIVIENVFSNERYATSVRDGVIAVSVPSHNKIVLVTADESYSVRGEINCVYKPKALHGLDNGDLALSWDEPVAFGIISSQIWNNCGKVLYIKGSSLGQVLPYCEKVYFTSDKSGRQFESFDHIAVNEVRRRVIQPCNVDEAVYCFDFDGNPVFRYSNDKLREPRGVALDKEGNIYVCEMFMNCVHIISPAGIGIIIIEEGCPEEPLAIGFNKDNNTFAVTQYDESYDSVHFFSIVSK